MEGYVVCFYKYPEMSTLEQSTFLNSLSPDQSIDYISMGSFDRMTISHIRSFNRYRDISKKAKKWKGKYQSTLLFSLNEIQPSIFVADKDEYLSFMPKEDGSPWNFIVFSTVSFSCYSELNYANNQDTDYQRFLDQIASKIKETVATTGKNIRLDVFGNLGSQDICIIWLADQYTDVLECCDSLQHFVFPSDNKKYPVFMDLTSVVSINRASAICAPSDITFPDIRGTAIVSLKSKKPLRKEDISIVCKDLRATSYTQTFGEFDLIINCPAAYLIRAIQKDGILHYSSDFYKQFILQVSIQPCLDTAENNSVSSDSTDEIVVPCSLSLQKEWEDAYTSLEKFSAAIDAEFHRLRNGKDPSDKVCIKNLFSSKTLFIDDIDALYLDYRSNTTLCTKLNKRIDYSYQFLSIIETIQSYLKKIEEGKNLDRSLALENLWSVIGEYSLSLNHIAQSNMAGITEPICQTHYNGHQGLIINTYYGILKAALKLIYSQSRKADDQYAVCPVITISPGTEIKCNVTEATPAKRLLRLSFPTSVMQDIPFGSFLILHEVCHCVVPKERKKRNVLLGSIYIAETVRNAFIAAVSDIIASNFKPSDEILWEYCEKKGQVHGEIIDTYKVIKHECSEKLQTRHLTSFISKAIALFNDIYPSVITSESGENNEFFDRYISKLQFHNIWDFNKIYQNEELLSEIYDSLRKSESNNLLFKQAFDQEEAFFDAIKNYYEDSSIKTKITSKQKYKEIEDICEIAIASLVKPFYEIRADIVAVEALHLSFLDYILFFVQNKIFILNKPNRENQDILRIGLMAYQCSEIFVSALDKLKSVKNEFIERLSVRLLTSRPENISSGIKEAKEIAEKWYNWLEDCCNAFDKSQLSYLGIYDALLQTVSINNKSQILGLKRVEDLMSRYKDIEATYAAELRKKDNRLINALSQYRDDLFSAQMDIILSMQVQPSLAALEQMLLRTKEYCGFLSEQNDIIAQTIRNYLISYNPSDVSYTPPEVKHETVIVTSPENILDDINACKNMLYTSYRHMTGLDHCNMPLWFRGERKDSHVLLPSIYRKSPNPYILEDFLNEFKYRADGTLEKDPSVVYHSSDYLALMQHFSVPTNFLDFSENAFSSLYFALEDFFPNSGKEHSDEDAKLYVFSPYLYNIAVAQMAEKLLENTKIEFMLNTSRNSPAKEIIDALLSLQKRKAIPNLSIPQNEDSFYFLFPYGAYKKRKLCKTLLDADNLFYPVAVYTSLLNPRIKAQHGAFVAFNTINLENTISNAQKFSLNSIQEKYLKEIPNAEPFLYGLKIKKKDKDQYASMLRSLGINRDLYYPELKETGERVAKMFG